MIEIVITIGPRVVVDAAQACQESRETRSLAVAYELPSPAMFGIQPNRLEPLRQTFAHVLLKKAWP